MRIRGRYLIFVPCLVAIGGPSIAQGIQVSVNGEPVQFSGIGPRQMGGRVLVPLRGVLEKLGAYVDWVPSTHTVVASRGNMDLQLQIGSRVAQVNGREVSLDVPAMTLGGSTMVPLRFVGETLGADVRWDGTTQTVMITTAESAAIDADAARSERRRERMTERERDAERSADRERGNQSIPAPQPPVPQPSANLNISSITHDRRGGWLHAGDVLTVRMRGTPRQNAEFRIPGVVDTVPMRETQPGAYEGSWTVPGGRGVNLSNAAVIGGLKSSANPNAVAPLVQSGDLLQVDTTPPTIADLNPAPRTQVSRDRPLISATLSDQGGSGVAPDQTRVLVDGREVTNQATVTGQFFTYTPTQPLAPGNHTVDVMTRDRAGNDTRQTWGFTVPAAPAVPRRTPVTQTPNPPPVNPATLVGIGQIETNAAGDLHAGDTITVRVTGTPGATGRWSLGPIKDAALREQSRGIYVGSYQLRPGDDMQNAHLMATLTLPDGRVFTDSFDRAARVQSGPPQAPVITSPRSNGQVVDPLIVRGTAQPNSTVRLKVDYVSRVLNVLGVRGSAAQQEIKVGQDGRWASQPISLSSLFGHRDTDYTVTAVAISPTNQESAPATLRLR